MSLRIDVHGRIVDQITSDEGHRHYYDHFLHHTRPDCRPVLSGVDGCHGLVLSDGRELVPEKFVDIFTQFDAVNHPVPFIPVFNGEAWGLISISSPHIMVTDFIYKSIIPERWEHSLYFVQDKDSLKWGALGITYPRVNLTKHRRESIPLLKQIMPPIADEILEDELMGDCSPTVFWMTRIGDKIGILTPFGYSQIIFDKYETDDDEFLFHMFRYNENSATRLDYSISKYF